MKKFYALVILLLLTLFIGVLVLFAQSHNVRKGEETTHAALTHIPIEDREVIDTNTTPTPTVATSRSIEVESSQAVKTEGNRALHTIRNVIDGDTFVIDTGEHVRIIGINTPEVFPKKECYGPEAKEAISLFLEGASVSLTQERSNTDKYGRLLRHVTVYPKEKSEGLVSYDLALALLNGGYARAKSYKPDTRRSREFQELEKFAQQEKRGLWGACVQ